jgi:hypothetical protein
MVPGANPAGLAACSTAPSWWVVAVPIQTICPYKRQRDQDFDVQAKWKPFGG